MSWELGGDDKLGEVRKTDDGQRWILTSIYPSASGVLRVWSPIPEGDDETGLGRRYRAACVVFTPPEPVQRLERYKES